MKVEAVALQLAPTFGDVEGNLARLAAAVRDLPGKVDLVVAPELYTSGYDLAGFAARGDDLAESLDGPTVGLARTLAADREATLVVGLLERGSDGAHYDTAVTVTPDGVVTPYRKTHLYPGEKGHFAPGQSLRTARTPVGAVGTLVCFEHAFPELATTLALDGAQIIAIPSAVPQDYEYLLELRSRARAQDNQVFVVASNLTGGPFCGRSLIADPKGRVLAAADDREEAAVRATLDLDLIVAERAREPNLIERRPELYR